MNWNQVKILPQNGAQKTPISVILLALESLVALHCAKTVSHFKDMTQIFQKALQYPRDLVGPLMNLKKSDLKLLAFMNQIGKIQKVHKVIDPARPTRKSDAV